jgi:exo-beta-1,3-glucanase (GH17 family)
VYLGVAIGPSDTTSQAEIADCVAIAKSVGVQAIIVGSEVLLSNYITATQLIGYINQVRAAVPGVPVSTAETFLNLMNNPSVISACDFVFPNLYGFYAGSDVTSATALLNAEDKLLRATYGKTVIVSETGTCAFIRDYVSVTWLCRFGL